MSLLIAMILAQAGAAGAADECYAPETQQAMNYCAAQDFHAADAALNAQWTVTAAAMRRRDANAAEQGLDDGRPGNFEQLLAGQRAWLAFRDAHCAIEGYAARGGSLEPMLVATCRANLTKLRTDQLSGLIAYWDEP